MDLVAPGDTGWASSDDSIFDVAAFAFNGTSESSPFVAGAAALVIQAYRMTHRGASPTPALVKQILLSTASDLGAPANEQGAGLLNTYQAVLLAESVPTGDGSPKPAGNTLLFSTSQLSAVGEPSATQNWSVTVTNTGAFPQVVNLSGRTLGPAQNVQGGTVTLNDATSPKFIDAAGYENNWATFTFTLPPGADRLDASLAYPGTPAAAQCGCPVNLVLIDPLGRFAANSVPYSNANFAKVDVAHPLPGTWTGAVFGIVASVGGVNGNIQWRAETERFVPFGSVSPSILLLGPGQSESFSVSAATPSSPGDLAGSIQAVSDLGLGDSASIPVTLRSLVDVAAGGKFNGVLTGGDGGNQPVGQVQYYEFDVPSGVENITANVSLANDANNNLGAYLISPDGDTLGYGTNSVNGTNELSLTAYTLNPVPGRWTLIVDLMAPVVGNEISDPYTGNIVFNQVTVSAPGLPDNVAVKLAAGTPVIIPVTITNNGAAPEDFFIDARLDQTVGLVLAPQFGSSDTVTLPMPATILEPSWFVPTETSSLSLSQTSTVPAMFDFSAPTGDPWLASAGFGAASLCSKAASASYTPAGGSVTPGPFWSAEPTECGPFATAAPTGSATISMTATTKAFDPAVTSPTGDLWLGATNPALFNLFSPIAVGPGQTGTIAVTITPSGASGTVVKGALYVGAYLSNVPPFGISTGNELAVIPYAYTIK